MGDKCEQPCQIVCVSQCFFWTFSVFGLGSFRLSRAPDKKKKKKRSWFLFRPIITRCFVSIFPTWSPRKWHHAHKHPEKRKRGFPPGERRQKSFNCFLINRCFITWNINHGGLFKTGPGADGDLHTQASFSSPIISSLIFHLVASVNQRIPLMKVSSTLSFWRRCQTDVGIWVGNLKGLACSSGVKGRANYIDKHAWDSSSVRQPFQQRETLSESDRTWIFLFFLLPPHDTFPVWLTDKS